MDDNASQAALFDAGHLARYTLGDAALEREVLAMFVDQAEAQRDRLAAAADERQWREAAHTLKGAARGIGAFRLGDAAARLEALAPVPAGDERATRLAALAADIAATRAALLAHIEAGG
jgi:HPt (histidine-containing phosphotransfer) domain-containing protein